MRLTEEQSRALLAKHGLYVTEACDRCGKLLGPVRFTRSGESGKWCSRLCRDGVEHKVGVCRGCGASLEGKRKGALFCSDVCRMRLRSQIGANNPKTPIQNTPLTDVILASGHGDSLELEKSI
jgi:hypothetical protein